MNRREKGLSYVREVRKILEAMDHQVEGPGYGSAWFGGNLNAIHRDFFSVFDLFSYFDGLFIGHQVTDLSNKSSKIKAIQKKKMPGWVWARCDDKKIFYRVFMIDRFGQIEEAEIKWRV